MSLLSHSRKTQLFLIGAILLLLIAAYGCTSGAAETPLLSECEQEVQDAAGVSDLEDSVEDLDPAIRVCESLDDFLAANQKHPGALDGVDARTFIRNRCTFNSSLGNTALCKEIAE